MDTITRRRIHAMVYTGGLALLAAGLPSSVFLMSISQIILVLNWLLEGRFHQKFHRFFSNRAALVFCSIYLVHLVALLYSSNWDYGISTLRTRLPILLFTLVVVSSDPLPAGTRKWIFLFFSASITVVSFVSLQIYFTGDYIDYRELSPFISHIRLSLMVALSVFTLLYFASTDFRGDRVLTPLAYILASWHFVYLVLLHSLSGVVVFGAVVLMYVVTRWPRMHYTLRAVCLGGLLVGFLAVSGISAWLWHNITLERETGTEHLPQYSEKGTPYLHVPDHPFRENGYAVYTYIADDELRDAWNQVSQIDYDTLNMRGEPLRHVLYRFMASRGLRKDARGFQQLTAGDVKAVEQGVTNVHYKRWPWLLTRMHQTLWEIYYYNQTSDPEGHSLAQRIEFWKAAREAILKKPLLGWGTGDIREAARYGLEQTGSSLQFERWMKPHNQFLSFAVLFGIPGALWILFAMVYPAIRTGEFRYFPFQAFFVILWLSMLNEDTIDTQAGLTFFVFFSNYFLFLREQ